MVDRVVCWDFDLTLGLFDSGDESLEDSDLEKPDFRLRKGLEGSLKRMGDRGYRHFITTTRHNTQIVGDILKTAGVGNYFEGIFGRDSIFRGNGKLYCPVADHEKVKISRGEIPSKMIVVGDMEHDRPIDVSDLLFVYQPEGYKYDSVVVERAIYFLDSPGGFNGRFTDLVWKGDNEPKGFRKFNVGDISMVLCYMEGHGCQNPVARSFGCEKYRKDPVRFV